MQKEWHLVLVLMERYEFYKVVFWFLFFSRTFQCLLCVPLL